MTLPLPLDPGDITPITGSCLHPCRIAADGDHPSWGDRDPLGCPVPTGCPLQPPCPTVAAPTPTAIGRTTPTTASAPALAPVLPMRRRDDRGQATVEYGLVIFVAGIVALGVIAWARSTAAFTDIFDAVIDRLTSGM